LILLRLVDFFISSQGMYRFIVKPPQSIGRLPDYYAEFIPSTLILSGRHAIP